MWNGFRKNAPKKFSSKISKALKPWYKRVIEKLKQWPGLQKLNRPRLPGPKPFKRLVPTVSISVLHTIAKPTLKG